MNGFKWHKKAMPLIGKGLWMALYSRFMVHKGAHCEANTLETTGWYLLPFIKDIEAQGVSPQEYTEEHLELRMAQRKQAGINNNTIRAEVMLVKAMFDTGVKAKLVVGNPVRDVVMPRKVKAHVPTPTPPKLVKLLRTIRDVRTPSKTPNAAFLSPAKNRMLFRRDTAITVVGARTAARPGEIFRFLVEDYQPEANRMAIRVAKDKEPRYVPIYADTIAVIEAWLKVRPKNSKTNHLFVSDRGTQMTVVDFSRLFKKYAISAGMPEITPRSLRHYGLTQMANINLLAASAVGGHGSPETTKGYLHNNFADIPVSVGDA